MPAAAVAAAPKQGAAPRGGRVPFVRASYRYLESITTDTVTLATSQQERAPVNVNPGGFLRGVWGRFTLAGGTLGSATLAADYPWNVISSIVLEDVNGAPILGPITGYELFLINKYGGYFFQGDASLMPAVVLTTNADFWLFLPCEFRSDGLGSLANTDARSQYRIRWTAESTANYIGTTTTGWTAPTTLTARWYAATWAQVEATNPAAGMANEQVPPGLGTTGFWVHENPIIAASALSVKHNRVGSPIRCIIYVMRTNDAQAAAAQANPRSDLIAANDTVRIRLDNRFLSQESINLRRALMARDYDLETSASLGSVAENGVLVYPFHRGLDNHPSPGDESSYLLTTPASYLAMEATFTGAGTLTILTGDVAIRGAVAMPNVIA